MDQLQSGINFRLEHCICYVEGVQANSVACLLVGRQAVEMVNISTTE